MKIYPIVEGYGDVEAVPVLLRRLRDHAGAFDIDIARPHRRTRSELAKIETLKNAVQIVLKNADCGAVIVILDADDDCPKEMAPALDAAVKEECRFLPAGVVVANKEFEAWFLANTSVLIDSDAPFVGDPEGNLATQREGCRALLSPKQFYDERTDQPRFAARMDLAAAYERCRSFRRLISVSAPFWADGRGLP